MYKSVQLIIFKFMLVITIIIVLCVLFRVVRLTSPNLNYFIILGAVLFMIANVFMAYMSNNPLQVAIFCQVSNVHV